MKKTVFLVSICVISLLGVLPNLLLLYLLVGRRDAKLKKPAAARNAAGGSMGGGVGGGSGGGSLNDRASDFPILLTGQCINHVLLCVTSPLDVFFISMDGSDVEECIAFLSVKSILMLFSVLIVSLQGLDKVYRVQNLRKFHQTKMKLWVKIVAMALALVLSSVPLVLELILTEGRPLKEGCSVRPAVVDVMEAVFFLGCVVSVLALVAVVAMLRGHSQRVAAEGGACGRGQGDVTISSRRGFKPTSSAAVALTSVSERVGDGGNVRADVTMKSMQRFMPRSSAASALTPVSQRVGGGDGDGTGDSSGNVTMIPLQEFKTSKITVSKIGEGGDGDDVRRGSGDVGITPMRNMTSKIPITPIPEQERAADSRKHPQHVSNATATGQSGKNPTLLHTRLLEMGSFTPHNSSNSNNNNQSSSNDITFAIRRVSVPHDHASRPLKRQQSWSGPIQSWVSPQHQRVQTTHQHPLWTLGEHEIPLQTYYSNHTHKFLASFEGRESGTSTRVLNTASKDFVDTQNRGATTDITAPTKQYAEKQLTSNQTSSSFTTSLSSTSTSSSAGMIAVASSSLVPGELKTARDGRVAVDGQRHLDCSYQGQQQAGKKERGKEIGGGGHSGKNKSLVVVGSLPHTQSCPGGLSKINKSLPPCSSSVTLQRLKTATVKAARRGALMVGIFLICYLPLMVSLLVLSLSHPVYETVLLLEGLTLPISYVHALVCPIAVMATDPELKLIALSVLRVLFCCRKKQAVSITTM